MAGKFLTMLSLGEKLDFRGSNQVKTNSARAWVARAGLRKYWRGRTWLVREADVEKALAGEPVKVQS